jgi:hypothetical protein
MNISGFSWSNSLLPVELLVFCFSLSIFNFSYLIVAELVLFFFVNFGPHLSHQYSSKNYNQT